MSQKEEENFVEKGESAFALFPTIFLRASSVRAINSLPHNPDF